MLRRRGIPSPLTEDEIGEWLTTKRPTEKKRQTSRMLLFMRNPYRLRQLEKQAKWARKVLAKAGHDPEEIRWLV